MTEHQLEPKENFHIKIKNYFLDLDGYLIPTDLLSRLIDKITDTQYVNYKRLWNQYPKSRKRYTRIKLEDLEHPVTHYEITYFFRNNDFANYKDSQ